MPSSLLRLPLIIALLASLLVGALVWKQLPLNQPGYEPDMDRWFYVEIARGNLDQVIKPFSKRILHPKAAAWVSRAFGLNWDHSFFFLAVASLLVLMGSLAFLFKAWVSEKYLWLTIPMVTTPYLGLLFYDYYMHDLFFSALLGLFFLCFAKKRIWLALPILCLLLLAREATLLLGLVLIAVSLLRRDIRPAAGTLLALATGAAASYYFGHLGLSNLHQLGELFFMVFKIGYNVFGNFFGVNLWVNTHNSCQPIWEWPVTQPPAWLPLGLIRGFGLCGFDWGQPVHTLYRYLTIFGVGPSVLLVLIASAKTWWRKTESWVLVALVYGLASYLLGPVLGPGGFRLMGYGWPAFWIAAPILAARSLKLDWRSGRLLLLCHLALAWLPEGTQVLRLGEVAERGIILFGALALQIAAFRILRRFKVGVF